MTDTVERFELGDGRVLEIRPTTAADGPALQSLYDRLPRHDVHLRFFSAFNPRIDWCTTWASVAERGGFGVIAIVHRAPPPGGDVGDDAGVPDEVVGEAGYAVRADGDGDLAVTVAPPWRGWLGPYLLEVIVRHAAGAGIANLQADVLVENRVMLGLLRHRGAVALEHPDGTARLSISTSGHLSSWPPVDVRPRVLVEVGGGRWNGEQLAREAGLTTMLCSGPDHRPRGGCPLLAGGDCPLADGADAIVVLLDPDDEQTAELLARHRQANPNTPVLVRRRNDATPADCRELPRETRAAVTAIADAASSNESGRRAGATPPR
jgi:hypothetical protein